MEIEEGTRMDDDNDDYMKDPRAKSVEGFVAGLTILSAHMEWGMQQKFFCGGEHDIIHIYVGDDALAEDSDDGRALAKLGFHVEDGAWAYFT